MVSLLLCVNTLQSKVKVLVFLWLIILCSRFLISCPLGSLFQMSLRWPQTSQVHSHLWVFVPAAPSSAWSFCMTPHLSLVLAPVTFSVRPSLALPKMSILPKIIGNKISTPYFISSYPVLFFHFGT